MHVEAMFSPETEGNVREVEGAAHEKGVQLQILKASNEGEIDAPHRPLPRASWGASGGKRTVIHSECGCYSITSSARARIDGGIVSPSALAVLRLITSSGPGSICLLTGRPAMCACGSCTPMKPTQIRLSDFSLGRAMSPSTV